MNFSACRRTRVSSRWLILSLTFAVLLGIGVSPAIAGRDLYVAPNGAASNDGSLSRPLDLATALSGSKALPGDTIWLRGGTYVGSFTSNLTGTAGAPITVRQFPGERATIDARSAADALVVNGSNAIYWGFEVTNSSPQRTTAPALTIYGSYTKFINLIVHEGGAQGVGFWEPAVGAELYGSIIYNNGFDGGDRGYGHSVYTQNRAGTKLIADNIMFNSYSFGIHAYTQGGAVDNFDIEGNILFNHGMASSISGAKSNLLLGGGKVANNARIVNNFSYYPRGVGGRGADIGYGVACNNAFVSENYFVGDASLNLNCSATTVLSNQFYGPISSNVSVVNNILYSARPTGVQTYVRPNKYEPGRANIAIFNWSLQSQVTVDLSQVTQENGQPLLQPGQAYEVRDAQNFFGSSVASGVFNGAITIPMTGLVAVAPIAGHATSHTGPEFGAFVILPLGGSTGLAASLSASPNQVLAGQPATLSWATNNATSVTINQGIGTVGLGGTATVNPTVTTTYTLTAQDGSSNVVTRTATVTVLTPSPDGAMAPPLSELIDTTGAVWSLASNGNVLRNGTWMGGGVGSKLLLQSAVIYTFGTDGNWWQWQQTSGGWVKYGPTQPGGSAPPTTPPSGGTSPDGSMAPPLAQLVDASGGTWALSGVRILRNGVSAAGGEGSKLLWLNGAIYTFGTDGNWWKWQGSSWTKYGPTQPVGSTPPPAGASPDGSMAPPLAQIVDASGGTWSLSGVRILRNGVSAAGGEGSKLLWLGGAIYTFGTDSNWWKWQGDSWTKFGPTQPVASTPPPAGTSPNGAILPPLTQIVDATGAVWTLASNGRTLRNGTWVGGGIGTKLLWSSGAIYTLGTDTNWWRWQNNAWVVVGPVQP